VRLESTHLLPQGRRMTMVELTRGQRAVLVDKLPDVASVAAGALVFGQFLGEHFSWSVAIAGTTLWAFLVGCAVVLAGGDQP
jgi:hypothetical protein